MGEIHAAVARGDPGKLDDLVSRREPVGYVLQGSAHAERALLHRLRDQLFHRLELLRRRRPVILTDHVRPQAAGADEARHVDGRPRALLEPREVVAEGAPILCDPEMRRGRGGVVHHSIVQRSDRRALTCHFCRHPLVNLAGRAAVHQDVELGLSQEIDEPRRDHEVRGVHGHGRAGVGQRADRGNRIADDSDITPIPGRSGAVDDAPFRNQYVKSVSGWLCAYPHTKEDSETKSGHAQSANRGRHTPKC
jgi:hypothetical protein